MEAEEALRRLGGAARRPAMTRLGVTDAALRRASRGGVLQPARGVYALASADAAHVGLVTNRQLLTCISAAGFYNLWVLASSDSVHVYQARGDAGVAAIQHRGLLLPAHPYRPVASLADVLIHALRCRPWTEALVMVECAVGRGDMTVDFLLRRLKGKRNGKARAVLGWVDRGAESLLETLARTHFRLAGISVQTQFYLEGVGYVDLILEGWLLVELDGRHHSDWAQVKRGHRRGNVSAVKGYTVLRYYYADVVHNPEEMVQEVLAVLARGNRSRRRHAEQGFAGSREVHPQESKELGWESGQKVAGRDMAGPRGGEE
ncbi:Very-short-patch-repair endonuclease [Arthrobacter sp. yr096]|nr:Very-short-patch-repair endonuclease [Arthrobacter sp. yr096]